MCRNRRNRLQECRLKRKKNKIHIFEYTVLDICWQVTTILPRASTWIWLKKLQESVINFYRLKWRQQTTFVGQHFFKQTMSIKSGCAFSIASDRQKALTDRGTVDWLWLGYLGDAIAPRRGDDVQTKWERLAAMAYQLLSPGNVRQRINWRSFFSRYLIPGEMKTQHCCASLLWSHFDATLKHAHCLWLVSAICHLAVFC